MRSASFAVAFLLAASCTLIAVSSFGGAASTAQREAAATDGKKPLSDAQIKKILIDESIAAYQGNCPCPYSTARNGSRCGKRSAWSRAGGAEPLCYANDVSAEMVQDYRNGHTEQ
jgi:hypothetical protein